MRSQLLGCVTAALLLAGAANAISWPLCADGGSVWVTERPFTGPQYPGANLWFFCDGALNVLGDSVDPCIFEGSLCDGSVTDAICRFLGYDQAYNPGEIVQADPDEAVRSLTGEYCLRQGIYSRTKPSNLTELPGEPCNRIEKITCIRTIESMADRLEEIALGFAANETTPGEVPAVLVLPDRPNAETAGGGASTNGRGQDAGTEGLP